MENLWALLDKPESDNLEPHLETIRNKKGDYFVIAFGLKEEASWSVDPSEAKISTIRTKPHEAFIVKIEPIADIVNGTVVDGVGNTLSFYLEK